MKRQEYRLALQKARCALIEAGYCGHGEHGPGDPEVNAIDRAVGMDLQLGNILFNVEQAPERHTVPELLTSIRTIVGLAPGERP